MIEDADLDRLFEFERDPRAVALAAFTRPDPGDRAAFDRHYQRIRLEPGTTLRAIDVDGALAGMIASFTVEGEREVTYWIDPARWGRGLASAALVTFLHIEVARPLFARVAEHNVGSTTVLVRAGFVRVDAESSFAHGVGRDVVEHVYRLGGG